MQNASETKRSDPQVDAPQGPNYETLRADVDAWKANWIQYVEGEYGAEAAEEAAAYLDEQPWVCLKWFVGDNTPRAQREEPMPFL